MSLKENRTHTQQSKGEGAGGPPEAWALVSELIPFDNIEDEGHENTVPSVCLSNDLHDIDMLGEEGCNGRFSGIKK